MLSLQLLRDSYLIYCISRRVVKNTLSWAAVANEEAVSRTLRSLYHNLFGETFWSAVAAASSAALVSETDKDFKNSLQISSSCCWLVESGPYLHLGLLTWDDFFSSDVLTCMTQNFSLPCPFHAFFLRLLVYVDMFLVRLYQKGISMSPHTMLDLKW